MLIVRDADKQPCREIVRNLVDIDRGTLGEEYFIRDSHVDGSFGISLNEYQEKGLQLGSAA